LLEVVLRRPVAVRAAVVARRHAGGAKASG
jgi:hypothetical protein